MRVRTLLLGVGLAILVVVTYSSTLQNSDEDVSETAGPRSTTERPPLPPPTEHWQDHDAERAHKTRRKEWHNKRHRAAPDVDWRAIERRNGLRQVDKRNALARTDTLPNDPQWVERGSENQAGRMHVTRHSTDGTGLYAGSSLGGVWRGDLEGGNWTPIGDNLFGGAHWLEVFPATTEDKSRAM